jgi:hypothetical protein
MITYPLSSCSQGSTVFSLFSSCLFWVCFPFLALLPQLSLNCLWASYFLGFWSPLFLLGFFCALQQYGLTDLGFYLLESYIHQFQIFTEWWEVIITLHSEIVWFGDI